MQSTHCSSMSSHAVEGEWREPTPRYYHSTAVVGDEVYLWAGEQRDMPEVHNSAEKQAFLSSVEVFSLNTGCWEQRATHGTPPLGISSYSCVAVGNDLHYFGGKCSHRGCYHNSVHTLNTSTLQWRMLAPTTSGDGAPMSKSCCGVADQEENFLFAVGGHGSTPSSHQQGAQYQKDGIYACTNEQHIFSLSTCECYCKLYHQYYAQYCDCISVVVRDDLFTFRWLELTQGHRTSSSPMFSFHVNRSRREKGGVMNHITG